MMKISPIRLLPMAIVLVPFLVPAVPARADDAAVVASAAKVLELMANNPDTGVPVALLQHAEGVVIVPNLINAGFGIGVKLGRGVFLVRDAKGRWGNPIHVFVSGGTLGLQIGGQATEMLTVFRTKESVNRLLAGKGKITLGVDAGVAAGPVGTNVGAETDLEMRAEILSYAKSRGLFAGASFGGTGITVDRSKNCIYYDNFAATTVQMIEGDTVSVPVEAAKLKAVLTMITNPPGTSDQSRDPKVSRSSRTRGQMDDDDDPPPVRTSTRRRRPAPADGDDDPAPPRTSSRPTTRPRPPANDDDSVPDDLPPPTRVRPVRRPAPPADDSGDDLPPPTRRKKPAPADDDPPAI